MKTEKTACVPPTVRFNMAIALEFNRTGCRFPERTWPLSSGDF